MSVPRKPKLGFGPLALLEWVTEKGPNARFFTRSDGDHLYLYTRTADQDGTPKVARPWPPSGDWRKNVEACEIMARFDNKVAADTYAFRGLGLFELYNSLGHAGNDRKLEMKRYQAFVRDFVGRDLFHFSQTVYVPTARAFTFMAEVGAAQLAELRSKRAAARAAVTRTIVIGNRCTLRPELPEDIRRILPKGAVLPLPTRTFTRAYATATVISESKDRLYLAEVVRLPEIGEGHSPISGSDPQQYIHKSAVLLDHASPETASAIAQLDSDYVADFQRMSDDLARKTIAMVTEMHSKMLQKDAEYRDSVQELLSGAVPAQGGPKP